MCGAYARTCCDHTAVLFLERFSVGAQQEVMDKAHSVATVDIDIEAAVCVSPTHPLGANSW